MNIQYLNYSLFKKSCQFLYNEFTTYNGQDLLNIIICFNLISGSKLWEPDPTNKNHIRNSGHNDVLLLQAIDCVPPQEGDLGLSVVLVDGGLDVADQIDQGVNHGILDNKSNRLNKRKGGKLHFIKINNTFKLPIKIYNIF